jgi:hypothetical protein
MLLASVVFFLITALLLWIIVIRPVYTSPSWVLAREKGATFWTAMCRFRTIVAAKLVAVFSALAPLYDQILTMAGGVNWTPITTKYPILWPISTFLLGMMFLYLRKLTTAPPPTPGVMFASADSVSPPSVTDVTMAGQ